MTGSLLAHAELELLLHTAMIAGPVMGRKSLVHLGMVPPSHDDLIPSTVMIMASPRLSGRLQRLHCKMEAEPRHCGGAMKV